MQKSHFTLSTLATGILSQIDEWASKKLVSEALKWVYILKIVQGL